ncbi:4-phosphopantetheinyl transferase [Flavobacteriaceae bacterium CRH]|nr:4-phosphopantetheinyl transferase [Flavobacteriaceae bacterium CRH]
MIYLYYAYLAAENHENLLKNKLPEFSFSLNETLVKNKRWQHIQLSLLGRILLFTSLKKHYHLNLKDDAIKYNAYNKPFFEGNPVYFNISHSGEIVVCAVTDSFELGIDIEKIHEIDVDNFRVNMTNNEWHKIIASDPIHEAFFDYWTQKEAVIKASGAGQSIPLNSFEVIENSTVIKNEKLFLKEIKLDKNYKCYVASQSNSNDFYIEKVMV